MARDMNEPEPPVPEDLIEDELNYLIDTQQIQMDNHENVGVNYIQNELIRYFSDM